MLSTLGIIYLAQIGIMLVQKMKKVQIQGGINFLGQTFSSIYSILLEVLKCLVAHMKVHKSSFSKWYNNLLQRKNCPV